MDSGRNNNEARPDPLDRFLYIDIMIS
jgi:hypothetical protein